VRQQEEEAYRQAAEDFDTYMTTETGEAWQVITSGELYLRYGEPDEFTCGMWDCLMVVVYSRTGCPGGVYVEAAIERDGVVVGWTNDVVGALSPDQTGTGFLDDIEGTGGTFRVNEVVCR